MYGKNLVICDCEEQYAKNLLQVLSHVHQTETSLYLFYTIQELKKFSEQKRIDCLLISSDYEQAQREEIPAEKKYVLVREKQPLAEGERDWHFPLSKCRKYLEEDATEKREKTLSGSNGSSINATARETRRGKNLHKAGDNQ